MHDSRYTQALDMFPNTSYLVALKNDTISYLKNKIKKKLSSLCYSQLVNE